MSYKIEKKVEKCEGVSARLDSIILWLAYQKLCCWKRLTVCFKSMNENIVKIWMLMRKYGLYLWKPGQNKYLAVAFQPSTLVAKL